MINFDVSSSGSSVPSSVRCIEQCDRLVNNALQCLTMFNKVQQCSPMLNNVQQCSPMLNNVHQCSPMLNNVQQCDRLFSLQLLCRSVKWRRVVFETSPAVFAVPKSFVLVPLFALPFLTARQITTKRGNTNLDNSIAEKYCPCFCLDRCGGVLKICANVARLLLSDLT